jgi:hypothetical protein
MPSRSPFLMSAGAGFDYESPYGSPTATVTSFPSTRAGLNNNLQDFCFALDAEFTTLSDRGLIMEAGASRGMAWGVLGDGSSVKMRARAYSGTGLWSDTNNLSSKLEVDITKYIGRFNTFYLTGDVSVSSISLWVQAGGKGSVSNLVLLGTDTSNGGTNAYGGAGGGYGTSQGNMPDISQNGTGGASNNSYESIYPSPSNATWYKELRERTRGSYDFSNFGSSFDRV